MNSKRRLDGVREAMDQQGIDLVLYGSCPNFQYLTGIQVDWRGAPDLRPAGDLLLVPRDGDPVLISSGTYPLHDCPITTAQPFDASAGYDGMLNDLVPRIGGRVNRLALGAYLPTAAVTAVICATGNPEVSDGSRLMDGIRAIKEPEEIERLRQAARLTDDVMVTVIDGIRAGTSPLDLMLAMEAEARRRGASDVSFGPFAGFVESGSLTTFLESSPDQVTDFPNDKGLEGNTAITFDVGFVLNGYCSDWGRSMYWGAPPSGVKEAYAALCRSVEETVADMGDGTMRACDVYPAIEKRLDAQGFGDQMRARLGSSGMIGHQIGTEVHENPWLRPDNDEPLRAGMVMCIEPKLWVPGEYYMRLEDMVLITPNGAEFLTAFDRAVFEL